EDLFEIYQINVITAFLNYKYIFPVMERQKNGSILVISSVFAFRGVPHFAPYAIASHALLGFVKSAAMEGVQANVRTNALIPSFPNSPMMDKVERDLFPGNPTKGRDQIMTLMPAGRYVEPVEVADMALYLTSDRASFINGSTHAIDGAYLAK